MTIDPTFTANTEVRLLNIENALTDLWRLLQTVINKEQFNRLSVLRQCEMDSISTRLTLVESRLTTLEEEYNSLL